MTPSESRSFSRRDESARDNGHHNRPDERERFAMERVGQAAEPDGWEGEAEREPRTRSSFGGRFSGDRSRRPQGGAEEEFASDPEWRKVAADSEVNGKILAKAPESVFMDPADFSQIK